MDLKHIVANQRRRNVGPSLDIDFEIDRSDRSRIGPNIPFSRASSGTFVNKNGFIVGKTRSTTTINPVDYAVQRALTIDVPSGSVVGWVIGSIVMIMQDTDGDDNQLSGGMWIQGNILNYTNTTLTLQVTAKSGTTIASSWWVSYRGLRIDHDPISGRCLGALLERNVTNSFKSSSDFTTTDWNNNNLRSLIPVANAVLSPSGDMDANKLIVGTGMPTPTENANQAYWMAVQNTPVITTNTTYTYSGYLKAGEVTRVAVWVGSPARLPMDVIFELSGNGSIITNAYASTSTASIQKLKDGWYRVSITALGINSNVATSARLSPVKPTATNKAWGNGNGVDGFYAWGFQFEVNSYASSYIPTTASATTRAIDYYRGASSIINGFYNQNQSTVVVKYKPLKSRQYANTVPYVITNTWRNESSFSVASQVFTLGQIRHRNSVVYDSTRNFGAVAQFDYSTPDILGYTKNAFAVQRNNFAASVNGQPAATDNTGEFPYSPMELIQLGGNEDPNQQLDGHLSTFTCYPKRLTNEKIQELSTIVTDSLTLGEESIIYSTDTVTITI